MAERRFSVMNTENFNHQVWRTAILTLALAACLVFGIVVTASGDWLPGAIIIVSSTVGLAREVPEVRRLCGTPRS
jgi:hypothetical protein